MRGLADFGGRVDVVLCVDGFGFEDDTEDVALLAS